jgi:hypothetical protein
MKFVHFIWSVSMSFVMRFLSIFIFGLFLGNFAFAQDEASDDAAKVEELKGRVEGIDENVTILLGDVAGLKKFKFSGYIQAQYMHSEASSGFQMSPYDSTDYVKDAFVLRRGRMKLTYDGGSVKGVIQADYSNVGLSLKDAYIELQDPWTKYFYLTVGQFNRPNYEVEYSSSQRESMERSAVIRLLYPNERDLGAMIAYDNFDLFKLQFAAFNNTYLSSIAQTRPVFGDEPVYYMARLTKSLNFSDEGIAIDFGAHIRNGAAVLNTNQVIQPESNSKTIDSTSYKYGESVPRTWFGGELQFYWDFLGGMKILGEYILGSNVDQPSSASTKPAKPVRLREFSGWYAMLVKNITDEWQIALKYDVLDPNTAIADKDINSTSDLTTSTLGFGLHNYSFPNVRISVWYDMNDRQTTDAFTTSPNTNQLTVRFQIKY